MGILQFGWLAVNAWAVAEILCMCFRVGLHTNPAGAVVVTSPVCGTEASPPCSSS